MTEINPPIVPPLRFSTADLPDQNRDENMREFYGRILMRLDIASRGEGPIEIDATSLLLPGAIVLRAKAGPLLSERTPGLLADGVDDLVLSVGTSGYSVRADGREAVEIAPGDGFLCSLGHRLQVGGDVTDVRTVQLSRAALAPLVPGIDDLRLRAIPAANPALRLLLSYVRGLEEVAPPSLDLRAAVVSHLADLVALALGATRDTVEIAEMRGLRAARLQEVLRGIKVGFTQPNFSPSVLARKLGLSPRYIQDLLQETGATFSERVLELRLQKARTLLADYKNDRLKVSEIALSAGFGDVSYFNQRFRARFGASPTQVRVGKRERDA